MTIEEFNTYKREFYASVDPIAVLDHGYVKLTDSMGDDLAVANAARASFEKESLTFTKGDESIINFLAREDHTSPFRHEVLKFTVKAPLMVARQHWKYIVGSDHTMDAWNEASRRYVTANEEFYLPNETEWRSAPDNKKQGSGDPLDEITGGSLMDMLSEHQDKSLKLYKLAMDMGACAEQSRLFLPAYGLYVTYMWTASLQSVLHFLHQRVAHDAQKEIQSFAKAVLDLSKPLFPISFEAFKL